MATNEPVIPKASITIAVASEPPFALKPVA
jgi:hypothetical protein